jgi:hypothetical protein
MWESVELVLAQAFRRLGAVLEADLPGVVAMMIVLGGALALAFFVRAVLRRLLARVGFDRRAREWGMTTGRSLEPHHEPSWLVARGAFWVVMLGGIALALDVLGASTPTALGNSLFALLPGLVVGGIILLVGIGVARFLERTVLIGAVNRQIQQARWVALGVKWFVLILAAAMALEHVGVGGGLVMLTFAILLAGVVFAGALAVGLGARDTVARALERHVTSDEGPADEDETEEGRIQHL